MIYLENLVFQSSLDLNVEIRTGGGVGGNSQIVLYTKVSSISRNSCSICPNVHFVAVWPSTRWHARRLGVMRPLHGEEILV
jgi:hypothetical protein